MERNEKILKLLEGYYLDDENAKYQLFLIAKNLLMRRLKDNGLSYIDRNNIDDMINELYIEWVKDIKRYDQNISSYIYYIDYSIRKLLFSYNRKFKLIKNSKKGYMQPIDGFDIKDYTPITDPEIEFIDDEIINSRFWKLIDNILSPKQQQTLRLKLDGKKMQEISVIYNITNQAVSFRLKTISKKISQNKELYDLYRYLYIK